MILHLIYLACLLCSSLIGFLYRKDLQSRRLSLFPYYLLLLFAQELFVYIKLQQNITYSTGYIYNLYNPVNTSFYALFYYHIPFNSSFKRVIGVLLGIFLSIVFFTFLFLQPLRVYNNYLSLAGGFLITLCGLLFLFNYFKLDKPEEERKWLPVLWITIGLVTFYPVVNISFALYKYLLSYQATLSGMKLYHLIPQLMSIFMYVCFIRAFYLCSRRK